MSKIVFISNYFNHHQAPFSKEISETGNVEYEFVETAKMPERRKLLGWGVSGEPEFVKQAYDKRARKDLQKQIIQCDVAIIGSAPDFIITKRLRRNRVTFKYSERFYKNGLNYKTLPRAIIGTWLHHGRFRRYPLYMLCASAYTAADCAVFGNYKNRTYKWGYFPSTKQYDIDKVIEKKKKTSILWVGRFLKLKHPETLVEAAFRLKNDGIKVQIKMVGIGEEKERIKKFAEDLGVSDCIDFMGSTTPDKVRGIMENAGIFVMTSDFHEGWGAVVNEAMNSGCAVVASHAVGSVPFLIEHKENGLIYKSGNSEDFYLKVKYLLQNPEKQAELGKAAYETIANEWNASVAADRFVKMSEEIKKHGSCELYGSGPCSHAGVIKNDWFDDVWNEE